MKLVILKKMFKNFCKSSIKTLLLSTIFLALSNNLMNAENFSFSLSTKGIKFGSFKMTATEKSSQYRISSNFKSSGILGVFTKIEVSSGAYGTVKGKNIYYPTEVLSKWKSLFNQKESKIKYKNRKIIHYEILPSPRKNDYALKINELDNTIDPLTLTYWLLKKRNIKNICKGEKLVSEGQTLIKVVFFKKNIFEETITCDGEFQFIKGFDPSKYKKKNYRFTLNYNKNKRSNQLFEVFNLSFNSRIGIIKAIRL